MSIYWTISGILISILCIANTAMIIRLNKKVAAQRVQTLEAAVYDALHIGGKR